MTMETRHTDQAWPGQDLDIRTVGDGLTFAGYAAVFDSQSEDLGGFRERIEAGAFARSINAARNGGRDIKAFLNHNTDVLLGSTRAGTLRLTEDDRGLLAEIDLPDSEWGRPVARATERRDISAMSFGFTVPKGGDSWDDARRVRTLREVRLMEVSPVTAWPAYVATTASVRALVDVIDWADEASASGVLDGLTDEQRDVLHRLLNRDRAVPFPSPDTAALRERFAARMENARGRGIHIPAPEPQPGAQAPEPVATT